MTTKIETRQLYNRADLASLIAGDRVKIEADVGSGFEDESYLAVYEGCKKGKITFLSLQSEGGITLVRDTVRDQDISFDETGDLIIPGVTDDGDLVEGEAYEITSPEQERKYAKELQLLRQAGLYRG